jgi:hypothetical protein
METVRDVLDSVRAFVKARIANPLYVGYAFAWLILNFRLVLVLVGEGNWRDKIAYIDNSLYPKAWHWAWYGFGYPLTLALLFVVCSPFVYRWVTVFLRSREKATVSLLLEIAGETPLPQAAAGQLRKSLLAERQLRVDSERAAEERVAELNAQIDTLLERNKAQEGEIQTLRIATGDLSGTQNKTATANGKNTKQDADAEVFALQKGDFVGESDLTVRELVSRGLKHEHAQALYAIRNVGTFGAQTIADALGIADGYAASLLIDQLLGLKLIEVDVKVANGHKISAVGRQALSAAISRGFSATT